MRFSIEEEDRGLGDVRLVVRRVLGAALAHRAAPQHLAQVGEALDQSRMRRGYDAFRRHPRGLAVGPDLGPCDRGDTGIRVHARFLPIPSCGTLIVMSIKMSDLSGSVRRAQTTACPAFRTV